MFHGCNGSFPVLQSTKSAAEVKRVGPALPDVDIGAFVSALAEDSEG